MADKESEKKNIFGPVKYKAQEIYGHRNFIKAQVKRNLFGRYKNSYLGFAWNFITPMIYIILSYIIFTEIRANSTENYIVFLSSGIFAFTVLTSGITGGGNLFTGNSGMIKKMYFPREILAIINALSSGIVMCIGYVIVYILAIALGQGISLISIPVVIFVLICTLIFSMGCSLLLGSLSVYVRDVQYILGSFSIVFFVCTPIRTIASEATGILADIYWINPLTYFVEPLHQAIYYCQVPDLWILEVMTVLTIVVFLLGYAVFMKLKHGFVERL